MRKNGPLGQVIGDVGNLSYQVEVNRNRRWLRATSEKLEPSETSEPTELIEQTETSSVALLQPLVLPTPVVPEPPRLQDYEC